MIKEEKEAIDDLKLAIEQDKEELPYSKESLQYKQIILNLIDKQSKAINRLAQWVANLNPTIDKQSVIEIIYKEIENE